MSFLRSLVHLQRLCRQFGRMWQRENSCIVGLTHWAADNTKISRIKIDLISLILPPEASLAGASEYLVRLGKHYLGLLLLLKCVIALGIIQINH